MGILLIVMVLSAQLILGLKCFSHGCPSITFSFPISAIKYGISLVAVPVVVSKLAYWVMVQHDAITASDDCTDDDDSLDSKYPEWSCLSKT